MGSAEFFASAGVDILARLGVDTIAFGSESGDIELLRELALKAEEYKPSEDKSIGTAADYFASLGNLKSNDILGIEYLKAGKKFAPEMNFITVKREGAGVERLKILARGKHLFECRLFLFVLRLFDDG